MTTLLNNKFFVVFFAPFLLGAITMMGISVANKFLNEHTKIIIKIINFDNSNIWFINLIIAL